QAGAADHPGFERPRSGHPGAAGGDHHRLGLLSQAGAGRDHPGSGQADFGQQDSLDAGPCRPQGRGVEQGSGPVNLQADLAVLLPELILAVGAMVLLLAGAIGGEKSANSIAWGAIVLMAFAGVAVVTMVPAEAHAFGGAFIADGFSRFAKLLI